MLNFREISFSRQITAGNNDVGDNDGACNPIPFRARNSYGAFVEKSRNFYLLLIAYRSRAFTNPRQNHRDFACPACVTEPRTSLSTITVVHIYPSFHHMLSSL